MKQFKYFQLGGTVLGEDEQYSEGQTILNPRSIKTRNFWDWLTPWKTRNEKDLEALYDRGFIYQNDKGQLERVGKGYMGDGKELGYKQFSKKVNTANKQIERAQRLRALYGESPEETNMPGGNVRKLFDRGASTVKITPTTYKVSLNTGRMHDAYAELLRSLYANKNHSLLKQLSDNGLNPINDESIGKFLGNNKVDNEYLSSLGLNESQISKIMGLLPPKDPDNLPALSGIAPEGFDATAYELLGFANGLTKEGNNNYNNQLYNRVQGYRNAHGLSESDVIENPGDMRFHNDYYVYNQGDKDYYVGPKDVYDIEGKKRSIGTQRVVLKKGGIMKYFQTGGSINNQLIAGEQKSEQQQFILNLCNAAKTGDMETLRSVFGITPDKLPLLKKMLDKLRKQKEANPVLADAAEKALIGINGVESIKASKGAKLEYVQRLRGKCPEGYEMEMFKVGGKVGCKCRKKAEEGIKLEDGGESPVVQLFKKGRKCKK